MFIDFDNHYYVNDTQENVDHYSLGPFEKISIVGAYVIADGKEILFFNRDESYWRYMGRKINKRSDLISSSDGNVRNIVFKK